MLAGLRAATRGTPLLRGPVAGVEALFERYTDWRTEAFDRRYGTDTFTRVTLAELGVEEKSRYDFDGWGYCPVNEDFFHEMIRSTPVRPRDYTFIDVGSGKGKALMLASDHGFDRVIGVEISADLAAVARRNIARYDAAKKRPSRAESVCGDFVEYELPTTRTVFFLNDPFPLAIADLALEHIEETLSRHPRPAFLIYRKPGSDVRDRLDRSAQLTLRRSTPFWCIYASHGAASGESPASPGTR